MTTFGAPTADVLLSTLKQELEDASADTFERLSADLFCMLLGNVGVSKQGSQFRGNADTNACR